MIQNRRYVLIVPTTVTAVNSLKGLQTILPWYRSQKKNTGKFVNLAPTSRADETGAYFKVLNNATKDPDVYNIALTGPYGSGKSSVIRSFLKKYRKPVLKISLAAFLPEAGNDEAKKPSESTADTEASKPKAPHNQITKQEIERSILQQMLYGADANNLPLSRFKRIQTPKWWSWILSLVIVVGCLASWYIFQHVPEILSGKFFKPLNISNWLNLTSFVVSLGFCLLVVHHLYIKSFGLSLKSISLKDAQIAPDAAQEESILNRHLDEIIYFFQSTKYDLVIIEDLDRFNDADIFVTLREINSLINSNAGVKRHIRFLYALRDDMFVNTDRTKFFEFIVPVIPIINHSNSIDKVLEQVQRLSLEERLDPQFLREVSRYLSDLRLILNIFIEYEIYAANLDTEGDGFLDPNKLLAVLIYKNVLPSDFEALHRQKGVLTEIVGRYDEYVAKIVADKRAQIASIESEMAEAEKQLPKDLNELTKIYAMAITERLPDRHTYVRAGNATFSIKQFSDASNLEVILTSSSLASAPNPNHGFTQFNLSNLESDNYSETTFLDRKDKIETKSAKQKEAFALRIQSLKSQIATVRTKKFSEIIRENAAQVEDCFSKFPESRDLLKFLIFEGHLDDTYYQYISLFHSGRLSPNDNKFLIQIRSYNTPEPDFQIDNVAEVAALMRNEDFGQAYVLNRRLVDFLLDDPTGNKNRISLAVGFMASNFETCDAFFQSYYEGGKSVQALISNIIEHWPSFASMSLEGSQSASHAARVIAYAPEKRLPKPPYADGEVASYFSRNTLEVLNERIEFDLSRLKLLRVRAADLPSIASFSDVVRFVSNEALYEISIENIRFVLENVLGRTDLGDLETKHFTTILKAKNEPLLNLIEDGFALYVQHVLLRLNRNTEEEISAIQVVLSHEEVERDQLREFLEKQAAIFPSFQGVPDWCHPILLERQMIESSWENCIAFFSSESYSPEVMTTYLQATEPNKSLRASVIPDGDQAYELRKFLVGNNEFDLDVYRSYVRQLPKHFKAFPETISADKQQILIEEGRVAFSMDTFAFLEEHEDLQVLFIALNFDAYASDPDSYPMNDGFRKKLLQASITENQKRDIIRDIDPAFICNDASLASLIGSVLNRPDIDSSSIEADLVRAVIGASTTTNLQVSLLNKFHELLSSDDLRHILQAMPYPFAEIAVLHKSPKIDNTAANRTFVEWLKDRKLISSFSPTFGNGSIKINNFRRQ